MITYSIIQKSQLEGAHRLDAEYYQPEYLRYIDQLQHFDLQPLGSLTSKTDVGFVSSMVSHFQDRGIPLLRTQDVQEFFINLENDIVYIDEEFHKRLKKSQVFPGYLLLARSGSIGNVGIVPENFPIANSADIILIKISTDNVNPEFLAAFLNSKYGKFQTIREATGNVQLNLFIDKIKNLVVPVLKEYKEIDKSAKKACELMLNASLLYSKAECILLDELGIKNIDLTHEPCYEVNSTDTIITNRIDAEYYQPRYGKLLSIIQKKAKYCRQVREFRSINARGEQPIYANKGNLRVINSRHILEQHLDYEYFERTHEQNWNLQSEAKVFKYDILTYTTGANVGRTNIYFENDKALASNHVNILRLREENPIYVNVVLNSMIGRLQTRRLVTGSAQVELYPGDIDKFIIPFIDTKKQEHISSLVEESYSAKREAKALLEAAKKRVEDMIEKDAK